MTSFYKTLLLHFTFTLYNIRCYALWYQEKLPDIWYARYFPYVIYHKINMAIWQYVQCHMWHFAILGMRVLQMSYMVRRIISHIFGEGGCPEPPIPCHTLYSFFKGLPRQPGNPWNDATVQYMANFAYGKYLGASKKSESDYFWHLLMIVVAVLYWTMDETTLLYCSHALMHAEWPDVAIL